MRKKLLTLASVMLISLGAMAQSRAVSGTVFDKETKEPLMQTTIQLLKSDSTYVTGAVTAEDGTFKITAPTDGKFILRMTNIGYKNTYRNITVSDEKDVALGKIDMATDAVMLKEVVANGMAQKLVVKEDTFIYNAAAYRTPEGSVVEELVKRLPGAQVSEDGSITINGKKVNKICNRSNDIKFKDEYIKELNQNHIELSYETIEEVLSFPIDHSFLNYKKELINYGYQVTKISMKKKIVIIDEVKDE